MKTFDDLQRKSFLKCYNGFLQKTSRDKMKTFDGLRGKSFLKCYNGFLQKTSRGKLKTFNELQRKSFLKRYNGFLQKTFQSKRKPDSMIIQLNPNLLISLYHYALHLSYPFHCFGRDGRSQQPNHRFGLACHETCLASVFASASQSAGQGFNGTRTLYKAYKRCNYQ